MLLYSAIQITFIWHMKICSPEFEGQIQSNLIASIESELSQIKITKPVFSSCLKLTASFELENT